MAKIFLIIGTIAILMTSVAGLSGPWLGRNIIIDSKKQVAIAQAKALATSLSEQIRLMNVVLDKLLQDPEFIAIVGQNKRAELTGASQKIIQQFPYVRSVEFLLPGEDSAFVTSGLNMSFADLALAQQAFTNNPPVQVQSDNKQLRRLTIARRIMAGDKVIGVALVGVDEGFIGRMVSAFQIPEGYLELRQDKIILASSGNKEQGTIDFEPINVTYTGWQVGFEQKAIGLNELSSLSIIILGPILIIVVTFFILYRLSAKTLRQDISYVMLSFKEIMSDKSPENYPIKLTELKLIVSGFAQLKRVMSDKSLNI